MMEEQGSNIANLRIEQSHAQFRVQNEHEMALHRQENMEQERQLKKKIERIYQALRYGTTSIQTMRTEDLEEYRIGLNKYFPREEMHRNAVMVELESRVQKNKPPSPPTLFQRALIWWTSINTILVLFATLIIAGSYTLLQLSITDNWVSILGYIAIGGLTLFSMIVSVVSFWPRRHLNEFKYLQSAS